MHSAALVASLTAVSIRMASSGSISGLGHEIDAARARHADVAQHERDAVAPQLLQGLLPRPGGVDLKLLLGEELLEGVADRLLVVHDQHLDGPRALSHHGPPPANLPRT